MSIGGGSFLQFFLTPLFFTRRCNFSKVAVLLMVKYQFVHESEAYKMMLEVGVPADMVKPALSRF